MLHHLLQLAYTLIALAWVFQAIAAHFGLPSVPDLRLPEHDILPDGSPSVTVIVPARNEEHDIQACLESLLAQDYPHLQVITLNDRSTDRTGVLQQELAARHPGKLRAITITELPAGWLGKTHAMALAASEAATDFLLFTDADILFHPSAIRRALANAQATRADHLVLLPTTITKRWDEAGMLSFLPVLGLWAVRLWKVADPRARDAMGVGAFNLIRRSAYQQIGGFAAFPMEIVEDIGLARRVKLAGLSQRVAFGLGLVRVYWAAGVRGIVNVLTKNIFSVFNYRTPLLLMSATWLIAFVVSPFVAVFVPWLTLPAAIAIAAVAYLYVLLCGRAGHSAWNFLLAPFAALVLSYAMLHSMVVTLRQRGVMWRGTFYPLAELRRNTAPLLPRRPRRASKESR